MDALQKRKEEIVAELSGLSKQMESLNKQLETLRHPISKLELEYRQVLEAINASAPKQKN